MIIEEKSGYSYSDLTIVPGVISGITSRGQCNPYVENTTLPIFTAPMASVVGVENFKIWENNGIIPVLPRNIDPKTRAEFLEDSKWVALSLEQFISAFAERSGSFKEGDEVVEFTPTQGKKYYVCVDLANGHMTSIYRAINKAKEVSRREGYTLTIMTGNIANPETYEWICINAEVDYIRCSIGSGAGCLTTSNTGVHYPIATLIDSIQKIKDKIRANGLGMPCLEGSEVNKFRQFNFCKDWYGGCEEVTLKSVPKVIADGGIKNYSDAIKALALGADYVMMGGVLGSLLESAGKMEIGVISPSGILYVDYQGDLDVWSLDQSDEFEEKKKALIKQSVDLRKTFFGMSTKIAQKLINRDCSLKTSEGKVRTYSVTHTVRQWVENFTGYLRSAMSYCSAETLQEFIGKQKLIPNSPGEINAVNK